MFQIIIIMLKRGSRIIWRIYVNTLDFSGIFAFKRFQRKQIIAVNQHILGVLIFFGVTQLGILNQNPRLKLHLLVFANPC